MVDQHTNRSMADGPFSVIGVCLTWSSSLGPEELLDVLGGDTSQVSLSDFEEASELAGDADVILADRLGGWTVAVEPAGFQGSLHDNVLRASQGGQALSVFWNANLDARVVHCVDGRLHAEFDPSDPEEVWGEDPSLARSWIQALDWSHWRAAALSMGELLTGEVLDEAWLAEPRPCAVVLPEDERETHLDLTPAMREKVADDPRLAAIAADLTIERLPEITVLCVELASATAHLDREMTAAVLAAVRDGSPSREALKADVASLAETATTEAFATQTEGRAEELHQRATALRVLASALDSDPFRAAWDSTGRAGDLRHGPGGHVQRGILRAFVSYLGVPYEVAHPRPEPPRPEPQVFPTATWTVSSRPPRDM